MKTTKLIIIGVALVAIGVLGTGIAFAHYTTTPATGYNYGPYRDNANDWGWEGCYDGYYGPYGYQPVPESGTVQPETPLPPQGYYYSPNYPDAGYYPRSYGRGCWGW
ncbi:MAG: hypothetical protein NWF06_00910 [Candidatus Bathyarchaeota archaeon]|nr:hypothetical protein [Candidatus Bathyarchaeum sp.]